MRSRFKDVVFGVPEFVVEKIIMDIIIIVYLQHKLLAHIE